jgi:hypothetical protein
MDKFNELIELEKELNKLLNKKAKLELETQQEFLSNIRNKELALKTFLKNTKREYDCGISSLEGGVNWNSFLSPYNTQKRIKRGSYEVLEKVFTELYNTSNVYTCPNYHYHIEEGEIIGYTSETWGKKMVLEDLNLLKESLGCQREEKASLAMNVSCGYKLLGFSPEEFSIETVLFQLKEFVSEYRIAHFHFAKVEDIKDCSFIDSHYRVELLINGVFIK